MNKLVHSNNKQSFQLHSWIREAIKAKLSPSEAPTNSTSNRLEIHDAFCKSILNKR